MPKRRRELLVPGFPVEPSIGLALLARMTDGSAMRTLINDNRAVPTVQLDNDHLRVTEWRFDPGAATGYHRHAHDYVVVPILDGELELIGPDGRRARARLQQGKSYFRNAGVEHDVINVGVGVMAFVEIELKDTGG
jgi:quercetin dioxygenase-like cupin family protein